MFLRLSSLDLRSSLPLSSFESLDERSDLERCLELRDLSSCLWLLRWSFSLLSLASLVSDVFVLETFEDELWRWSAASFLLEESSFLDLEDLSSFADLAELLRSSSSGDMLEAVLEEAPVTFLFSGVTEPNSDLNSSDVLSSLVFLNSSALVVAAPLSWCLELPEDDLTLFA